MGGEGCEQEPLEPRLPASQHLAKHSLPSREVSHCPQPWSWGCFSIPVINPVLVFPPTQAPGGWGSEAGGGVSVEEREIQGEWEEKTDRSSW